MELTISAFPRIHLDMAGAGCAQHASAPRTASVLVCLEGEVSARTAAWPRGRAGVCECVCACVSTGRCVCLGDLPPGELGGRESFARGRYDGPVPLSLGGG